MTKPGDEIVIDGERHAPGVPGSDTGSRDRTESVRCAKTRVNHLGTCQCGGRVLAREQGAQTFSWCDRCTPVRVVRLQTIMGEDNDRT